MTLLLATVLMTVAVLTFDFLSRDDREVHVGRQALLALVILLPVLYAAAVLFQSREYLETLRLTYTGKRLAYGPDVPLTAGSSPADSETYEDLHAANLGPRALRLQPATEEEAESLESVTVGDPLIHLNAPSPIVRIDGVAQNSYALSNGDRIVLDTGDSQVELVYADGRLTHEGQIYALPGQFKLLLRGPSQVFYLPDLLDHLAPQTAAAGSFRSLIHRPAARSPWHLLIRDDNVTLLRGEQIAGSLQQTLAVPSEFELRFQIVWGRKDRRNLRTVRYDQVALRPGGDDSGHVEIRFGSPQRRIVRLKDHQGPLELGLVVPQTVDRREQLIEFDDASARFRGLSATLRYDPEPGQLRLGYLSGLVDVELGDLYALGESTDQMLVRLERPPFPYFLLVDLALFALFLAVFLGRHLQRQPALLAVVAPVGILIASRLLFSYRAANNPPHFFTTGYGEARLALWLVPATLLFSWSLAWMLRRRESTRQRGLRPLKWPFLGLGVASAGCVISTWGMGNLPFLGLLPIFGLGFLVLLHMVFSRPRWIERLRAWQDDGWPWGYRWLLASGILVLVVRGLASTIGMQETLRLPAIQFRLLWTVVQLPFCALVFALTLHLIDERRRRLRGPQDQLPAVLKDWLLGICSLGLFISVAYLAVAALVNDTGLAIAHSLSAVFGLLLLLAWPRRTLAKVSAPLQALYAAGLILLFLPLLLMLVVNVAPEQVVATFDWGSSLFEEGSDRQDEPGQVVDRRAQLMSIKSQRLFRLYMLGNPSVLQEVGLQPSERVAIHYHTLQSYATEAGFSGGGFASSRLPRHLGITYLSDLVPMVFVLADFGVAGLFALALTYIAILTAVVMVFRRRSGDDRLGDQGHWIAAIALLAFALPSLYMILANLNLVLFTGKNCNLLSLNSVSDVLESAGLLGLATLGLGLRRGS